MEGKGNPFILTPIDGIGSNLLLLDAIALKNILAKHVSGGVSCVV